MVNYSQMLNMHQRHVRRIHLDVDPLRTVLVQKYQERAGREKNSLTVEANLSFKKGSSRNVSK